MNNAPDSVPVDDRLRAMLAGVESGSTYLLKVVGDFLAPLAHDGDFAVCAPDAPLEVGKFAALWPKAGLNKGEAALKRLVTLPMDGWDKPLLPDSEVAPVVLVETAVPGRSQVIRAERLSAIHRVVGWYSIEPEIAT